MKDDRTELVAVALCEADGFRPYEEIQVQLPDPANPLALRFSNMARWKTYMAEARRHVAAFRVLSQ